MRLKVIHQLLKGLCTDSIYDARYSWTSEMSDGRYIFYGFTNSKITYNGSEEGWRLELLSDPNVYAKINTAQYPFGVFDWKLFGMSCDGNKPLGESTSELMTLSLNACSLSEFNCDDGR